MIHQLRQGIEKLQENPKINAIRKEAAELETLLSKQQTTFYHKINQIQELVKTNDLLVTQIYGLKTYYDDFDAKFYNYIDWKETPRGRSDDLARLEESIKDIVFGD